MSVGSPVYLSALGILSALGRGKDQVRENLFAGLSPGVVSRTDLLIDGSPIFVGQVDGPLPAGSAELAPFESRNLGLTIAAIGEIRADIDDALSRYGRERIAVVIATCTSGISVGEAEVKRAMPEGKMPDEFDVRVQEIGGTSESIARYLDLGGPAFSVSTACSSGANALAMARRLIQSELADAVIAGGVDSLSRLTVNGFHALSALSDGVCNPFSRNRDGTMLGEGAAIFLMEKRESEIALLGAGASTDAYNMTAPEPEGVEAERAIRGALDDAGLTTDAVDYVHLHGTGTLQNDSMESKLVTRMFGPGIPCGSSKGQIGHTLGTAGAMGAAHCWLAAKTDNGDRFLPPHLWDGEADPDLLSENLAAVGDQLAGSARGIFLNNAIGFGGNNAALVIGRAN